MTPRLAALLLAAALAAAAPAAAQTRPAAPAAQAAGNKVGPIARAFPYLDRFYRIPAAERTLFRLAYRVTVNDRPFAGRMWLLDPANRRTPVPLGPRGEIERLPTSEMLGARGWRVEMEAPAATEFGVGMELQPTLRPAAEMSAPVLAQTVAQANGAIRRAAGVARFAAPTMGRILFAGGRGGEAVLADGRAVPLPVMGGGSSFTPADHPAARTIRFAEAPTRLLIAPAAPRPRGRR